MKKWIEHKYIRFHANVIEKTEVKVKVKIKIQIKKTKRHENTVSLFLQQKIQNSSEETSMGSTNNGHSVSV